MAWYDEAVFYHIYPLGMTGAPTHNHYGDPEHRLNTLLPWILHIKEIGCNAIYIGPLFESVGHGYETTDYKKLDSRLGTNEDLTDFVAECHKQGVRVILDGVFNHVGRDFFAFRDLKQNRENSIYKDWFCNINFWGNNEYNDGFTYENWGGYNLLVKLNQKNPAVQEFISDVIRFWVKEYDIDGIRLDAADVLDFDYMQVLRRVANTVKQDFWLMGEVIHGDYSRWVNASTLHSVTNYQLHKALYSGHNDHNYFEIAHTVKRLYEMGGNRPDGLKLYNFVDNHDVERIYTKLQNKRHFTPVHVLLYTLPGIPSIYYGSEFGIEGRKERSSDASLRPALHISDYANALEENEYTKVVAALGKARQKTPALSYGDYKELLLTTGQYAFSRNYNGQSVLVTVNNHDQDTVMTLPAGSESAYVGVLSGEKVHVSNGQITVTVKGCSGEVWVPAGSLENFAETKPAQETVPEAAPAKKAAPEAETPAEVVEEAKTAAEAPAEAAEKAAPKTEAPAEAVEKAAPKTEAPAEVIEEAKAAEEAKAEEAEEVDVSPAQPEKPKTFEEMTVEELQQEILKCMKRNGPVTDEMRRYVYENVYHDALVTWVKSFQWQ